MMRGVDGLHVETLGAGDDVVLVHGAFGWGAHTFAEQRVLADDHRLHILDRRGYGASVTDGPVGWPVDVVDLVALLERLDGAHLVGHSYGGVDALLVAGARPELVHSLVVVEPPIYDLSEHPDVRELTAELVTLGNDAPLLDGEGFFARWADVVLGLHPRAITYAVHHWSDYDRIASEATRVEAMPMGAPVDWARVRGLDIPVVVASGGWPTEWRRAELRPRAARAALSFQDTARVIAERLGVDVVRFPDSSHMPQITEAAAFNDLLRETWLRSPRTGPC